jgi:hypothetical protein
MLQLEIPCEVIGVYKRKAAAEAVRAAIFDFPHERGRLNAMCV